MPTRPDAPAAKHSWTFAARFRAHALGWKSQPAVQRVKEAVAEIKKVARQDAILGAEGAVRFLEKVSPALEQVDSSSGAIGTAVNRAIEALVPIIASARAPAAVRAAWLERLWTAHADDEIPYIERLAEFWGELCASPQVASAWADRLLPVVRMAWSPDPDRRGYFHGTEACLSALLAAGRYEELLAVLETAPHVLWYDRRYGVRALAALGRVDEALRYAESSLERNDNPAGSFRLCEEILLAAGRSEEAYRRFALTTSRGTSNVATFRAIAKRYPAKRPEQILADLVAATRGEEGKWFAAAKDLGLLDAALQLARTSPCDPKTLNRAARDHVERAPAFALECAFLALRWIADGHGYEITAGDVQQAFDLALEAGTHIGVDDDTLLRARQICESAAPCADFLRQVLGRRLGLA